MNKSSAILRTSSSLIHPIRRQSFSNITSRASSQPNRFNYNPDPFAVEPLPTGLSTFRRETAISLRQSGSRRPPRRVRLLTRDFIEDGLCNPHYGYFATQVEIFDSPSGGIQFDTLRNAQAFENEIALRYAPRQSWHTPTELFKPWYARAVARCLLSRHPPHEPLRIYELGAGNGTLCEGVLDYLRDHAPEIYDRTTYTTVEVSARLASNQEARVTRAGHTLRIIPHNVFSLPDQGQPIEEGPCWVLAMELIDNLARDLIRHDRETGAVLMGSVATDTSGDFHELFEPVCDELNPLLARFLSKRRTRSNLSIYDRLVRHLPFAANLGQAEFVPTRTFELVEVLRDRFPRHQLLLSDFDRLPQAIKGIGAPVVQTRYEGMTVPCTTYLVQPGRFDIFFPTDFEDLVDTYQTLMNEHTNLLSHKLQNLSHAEFVTQFGEPEATKLKDGSNPMLEYYENVRVLVSE